MTPARRIETVLAEDGTLTLDRLPFRAGQPVEVIVRSRTTKPASKERLRGSVVQYERPTEPVAEATWDAAQ